MSKRDYRERNFLIAYGFWQEDVDYWKKIEPVMYNHYVNF